MGISSQRERERERIGGDQRMMPEKGMCVCLAPAVVRACRARRALMECTNERKETGALCVCTPKCDGLMEISCFPERFINGSLQGFPWGGELKQLRIVYRTRVYTLFIFNCL